MKTAGNAFLSGVKELDTLAHPTDQFVLFQHAEKRPLLQVSPQAAWDFSLHYRGEAFCLPAKRKAHLNIRVCLYTLVRPAGFEPVAYRVGVIRWSNGKPLGANGFVGFGQICEV